MLISTKQRAQSIQLLPTKQQQDTADTEVTAINSSAFHSSSIRSSLDRSAARSCSSSTTSDSTTTNSNSDKMSENNLQTPPQEVENSSAEDLPEMENHTDTQGNNKNINENNNNNNTSNNEDLKELSDNEDDGEMSDSNGLCRGNKVESIDEIYEYWKNFEIQKLKNDLNEQIENILQCQVHQDNLNSIYTELNQKLNEVSSEEILKTVSPYLNNFQSKLDKFTQRQKTVDLKGIDLLKLLTNVPDPFPVIELVRQFNESDVFSENRSLKENLNAYKYEIGLMHSQEARQIEEDKDLICNLSEQVGLTTSLNLELTSRLKLAEGEIESYKKILVDYQNEISDMKVKHLNEIKSEYSKESDKLKTKIDSQSQISESSKINKTTTTINTATISRTTSLNGNSVNNNNCTATAKSDKLTKSDQQTPISNTMTTSTSKWINGLTGCVNTDRLALLQSLTALSTANANSKTTSLKNLLNKTENTSTPIKSNIELHQFKPIFKIKTESEVDNDTAYDSANENDFDSEPEVVSQKCPSPITQSQGGLHSNYEPINTADIAQKVRDLLSVHNIGQRVFAKFILGLSQGTVSELLSKPKHWDKLTEKGRESYRKMYNWSCSEHSISTLKAISPRKGNKDNYFYQNGAGKEDTATEDRINQILSDAQRQMQTTSANKRTLSGSPSPSGSSAVSGGSPSMSPTSHQELLHKASAFLAQANHLYNNNNNNSNYSNNVNTENDDSQDEQEETNSAARTLSRSHHHTSKRSSNDNESSAYPLDLTVKTLPGHLHRPQFNMTGTKRIKIEDTDDKNKSTLSPLKHIQSIADAYLMSQLDNSKYSLQSPTNSNSFQRPSSTPSPALSAHGNQNSMSGGSSKALKCILLPVSQEQFDRYAFINTEELVKKVKDLLSKFSISQRLFGECILGLSQGSVSDLLARPKPWQMLTQKGREPFIRMQMFIDDPEAIKKLMANQYKSPTDKSTRPIVPQQILNSPSPVPIIEPICIKSESTNNALSKIVSHTLQQSFNPVNAQSLSQMFASFSHTQNLLNLTQHNNLQNNNTQNNINNENSNDSEMKPSSNQNNNNTFQPQINIIPYDISTMSTVGDLNTEEITNRVKETLLNNNIGQKLFGEAVLNLSQGTVSELLSKPKPWNTLSIKGREPYLRMYMWLNDQSRLEKLNDWKEEKNLLKRSNTEIESDHQKPKRRFIFSEEQKDQLMKAFKYDPYPAVNQMEALAGKLNLQTRTVINWFHNHRMRIRYKSSSGGQLQQEGAAGSGGGGQGGGRSRSSNQNSFDEFTKSLQTYTNGGNNNNSGARKFEQSSGGGGGGFQNSQARMQGGGGNANNSFYNYSNGNDTEAMNEDDEGAYDDDDFNEASIDDNSVTNQNNTTDDNESSQHSKANTTSYNHLPGYFSGTQQNQNNNNKYENERIKQQHTEDETDEDEIHESSVRDELDTDQEAEINSMYIPGNTEIPDNKNNNNNEEEEDYYDSGNDIYNNNNNVTSSNQYSSSDSDLKNQMSSGGGMGGCNNSMAGKRRKPHNPQKLSFTLNLLNNKLKQQEKVQDQESSANE